MGHEPLSLGSGSVQRSFGRVGRARGWVVGRALGVLLLPGFGIGCSSSQVLHARLRR